MGALIGGIVAVVLAVLIVLQYPGWWQIFLKALGVTVPVLLLLGGIIAIAAGISDLKDRAEEQKEKEKEEKKEAAAPK